MPLVVKHLKLSSLDCHALLLIVFVLILIVIDWFSGLLLVHIPQLLKMLIVAWIHGRRLRIPNVWNHGMVVISLVRLNTIGALMVSINKLF